MKAFLRAVDRRAAFSAARWMARPHRLPPGGRLPDLADIRRVLVVRLDSIGDMVLTTPFLRELRRCLPQVHITLVVRPAVHNLVALCPYVNEVLTYGGADVRPRVAVRSLMHARQFARRHFADAAFDLAILPRWEDDAAFAGLVAVGSGARWRVGYSGNALLTHVRPAGGSPHEAARNLDLIRFLGGVVMDNRLEVWMDDADRQAARDLFAAHGVGSGEFVLAVGPGAAAPRRRWPLDHFAETAAWSLAANGGFVLVVGGDEDVALGQQLRERLGPRVINAAGRATLRGTAALLRGCALFVGNDSGPMHLAAAAGVRVVEVSCHPDGGAPDHENSPVRFGPWGVPHRIVRPSAPGPHGITSIPVEAVTTQAAALMVSA